MNVTFTFPPKLRRTCFAWAAAAGTDVETIVEEFVTECLSEENPAPAELVSHDEFMAKLHGVIDLHPVSNGSMDDKDDGTIYEASELR